MVRSFHELTGAQVMHLYGASETSPLVTINRMKPAVAAKVSEEEAWQMRKYQGLVPAVRYPMSPLRQKPSSSKPFSVASGLSA
jgi:acyl-CoA synthetase (AMP-forming)/AMP-acid ligase II